MLRRILGGLTVFETPDDGGAAPPALAAVLPAPVEPPAAGDAPWAKDLATLFPDETVRTQVDTYLRANVQPHVTKIEQQYAPAKQLYDDLQGDESVGAWLGIARELYGDDVAEAVAAHLAETFKDDEPVTPTGDPATPPAQAQLTPEQQAAIEWAQEQQTRNTYLSELAAVKEKDPTIDGKEAWFANFVVGAEGDFPEALRRWKASGLGDVTIGEPAPVVEVPAVPAPATLTDVGAGVVPPVQTQFKSLDDALDSALDDMRAARAAPTTVGQV